MKRLFLIISTFLLVSLMHSCQELENVSNVPLVITLDSKNITDYGVTMSGSYSGLRGYGPLDYYFVVSTDMGLLESYDRSNDYSYEEIIVLEGHENSASNSSAYECGLEGLLPNTTYYYYFAISNGISYVRGEIHTFTTNEVKPEIQDVTFYNGYYYSGGYVYYDVEVDTNVDMSAYTDVNEYGIWVSFGTQSRFYPCTDSGNTLTAKIAVPESAFDVDTESYYWSAEVTDCKVGIYKDAEVLCKVKVSGLEYDIDPSIEIISVEQGETEAIDEDGWDTKVTFTYVLKLQGVMFMDEIYMYHIGNWRTPGRGGEYNIDEDGVTGTYSTWIKYSSSNTTARTDYSQVRAMVGTREIVSDGAVAYYLSGSYCSIYLYTGYVSETSSVKSSAMRLSIMKENADVPVCKVN